MLIIISYDIEKDKTRTRLAKKLKDYGPRVQKSVFEADVKPAELDKLRDVLGKVKLEGEDSIRLYLICAECAGKVEIWGIGQVTKDAAYYIA